MSVAELRPRSTARHRCATGCRRKAGPRVSRSPRGCAPRSCCRDPAPPVRTRRSAWMVGRPSGHAARSGRRVGSEVRGPVGEPPRVGEGARVRPSAWRGGAKPWGSGGGSSCPRPARWDARRARAGAWPRRRDHPRHAAPPARAPGRRAPPAIAGELPAAGAARPAAVLSAAGATATTEPGPRARVPIGASCSTGAPSTVTDDVAPVPPAARSRSATERPAVAMGSSARSVAVDAVRMVMRMASSVGAGGWGTRGEQGGTGAGDASGTGRAQRELQGTNDRLPLASRWLDSQLRARRRKGPGGEGRRVGVRRRRR